MEWREDNRDRQLENILTSIDVYYIDADNNNYHLAFQAHQREVHDRWSGAERPSDQLLRLLDTA